MLIQLIYSSWATENMTKSKLYRILVQARPRNASADLTGLLIFVDGVFLQILEGERDAVTTLMRKISCDPRHQDLKVILESDIQQRSFPSWEMAYASPSSEEFAAWAGVSGLTTLRETLETLQGEPHRISDFLSRCQEFIKNAAIGLWIEGSSKPRTA